MKFCRRPLFVVLVALVAMSAFMVTASAGAPAEKGGPPDKAKPVTPVPWEAPTGLRPFIGAPAQAHPIPPARVPQNPFLAPNPFNYVHNDPWMSDTYDVAGPLGRHLQVWSSTLAEARAYPDSYLFGCAGSAFDSHGRLVLSCVEAVKTGPNIEDKATAASLVLVDPETLAVLAHTSLPPPQPATQDLISSSYMYLDNQDRVVMPAKYYNPDAVKILIIAEVKVAGQLSFKQVKEYDVSAYALYDPDNKMDTINGLMADWQGRIWFILKNSGRTGVLDPMTGSVKTVQLDGKITNTFAMDRDAAYVATTHTMYRIALGHDGAPKVVWSDTYQNRADSGNPADQSPKPGQLSAGTGTSPTVLDNGKYVAITDNANQLHVVVYRTDAKLKPHEKRKVCEVPVFQNNAGADENSLIGSGRSLIAYNCYGNDLHAIWFTGKTMPSEPGIARVDIDPDGEGCKLV
jgi:hypothetical protein